MGEAGAGGAVEDGGDVLNQFGRSEVAVRIGEVGYVEVRISCHRSSRLGVVVWLGWWRIAGWGGCCQVKVAMGVLGMVGFGVGCCRM